MRLTITLKSKELMYDIENKAFLTGRAKEAENGSAYEAASNMQAAGDESEEMQLKRSMTSHLQNLNNILAEYADDKSSSGSNIIDPTVDGDEDIVISLMMPSNFNAATTKTVADAMHSYIVNMTLADWFTITNKGDVKDYVEMAAMSLENLKRALRKRIRPSRPTYGGDKTV